MRKKIFRKGISLLLSLAMVLSLLRRAYKIRAAERLQPSESIRVKPRKGTTQTPRTPTARIP